MSALSLERIWAAVMVLDEAPRWSRPGPKLELLGALITILAQVVSLLKRHREARPKGKINLQVINDVHRTVKGTARAGAGVRARGGKRRGTWRGENRPCRPGTKPHLEQVGPGTFSSFV